MTLKLVQRPAITVVGLHIATRPLSPEIPALWPKFVRRMDEIPGPAEPDVSYGVMWHGTLVTELHYMAAVSVSEAGPLPEGMKRIVIPSGTYASFEAPLSDLGKCFGDIFNKHLPGSSHAQVPGPYFERYDETFDPGNPASLVQICLPVKPR